MKIKQILIIIIVVIISGFFGYRFGLSQSGNFLKSVVEPGSMVTEASYVIFTDGNGNYYARNGMTGEIEFQNTNASYIFNSLIKGNTTIHVRSGFYNMTAPIVISNIDNLEIIGEGFPVVYVNTGVLLDYSAMKNRNSGGFEITQSRGIKLKNLCIMSPTGTPPAYGIKIIGGDPDPYYNVIEDCRISRFDKGIYILNAYGSDIGGVVRNVDIQTPFGSTYAIYIEDASQWLFDSVRSKGGISSIYITNGTGKKTERLTFLNCFFGQNKDAAMIINSSAEIDQITFLGGNLEHMDENPNGTMHIINAQTRLSISMFGVDIWMGGKPVFVVDSAPSNSFVSIISSLSNFGAPIDNVGINKYIKYSDFVTENSGSASGTSPIYVRHGLNGAPTIVTLGANANQPYSLSWMANSTHIAIYHNAEGSLTVTWYAEYKP